MKVALMTLTTLNPTKVLWGKKKKSTIDTPSEQEEEEVHQIDNEKKDEVISDSDEEKDEEESEEEDSDEESEEPCEETPADLRDAIHKMRRKRSRESRGAANSSFAEQLATETLQCNQFGDSVISVSGKTHQAEEHDETP